MSAETDRTPNAPPPGIRASTPYSPRLESLRGWAILLVFLFHADSTILGAARTVGGGRIGDTVPIPFAFITSGHTGVTLFFVLSAFLLSKPFLEENRGGRRVIRRHFFERRLLRIMPLYTVAVITAVILCLDRENAAREGLLALFFLNSFTGTAMNLMPYSAVWWSLATEAQFYVVLPLLGPCLRSRSGRVLGAVALIAWAIAYLTLVSDREIVPLGPRLVLGLSLLGRAPAFLVGIGAAWLVSKHGDRIREAARSRRWLRNGGADALLLATLLGLGTLLQEVTRIGFFAADSSSPTWHVFESGLWGFVVLLVVLAPLRSLPLISNRALETIGMLSYSIYLIHEPMIHFGVLELVARDVPLQQDLVLRMMFIVGAAALCLGMSALTYRYIERPFLLRKARIDR